MPRLDLDASLERLSEIRRAPLAADAQGGLREILGGPHSHAIARAAEIVAEAQLRDLEPDLIRAFERLAEDPVRRDPACRGKTAIVDALQHLDASEGDLYLRAARTVQLEPVYGGKQDMAPDLRGAAARGLVRTGHPEAMPVLAELLADPEPAARMAAVRAVAYHGGATGVPLLRLKALVGDPAPEVVGDCLLGLLQISAEDSLEFVCRFLEGEHAELALFALGESRAPAALPALQSFFERTVDPDLSRTALVGIAMMRRDEGIEWLLERIGSEPGPIARQAIEAFEIHRGDQRLVERVREVVEARLDVELGPHFETVLG